MAACSTTNHPRTGFLSLSPEIRNVIYELVYRSRPSHTIFVTSSRSVPSALSRTCRLIRHESWSVFLHRQTVEFVILKSTPGISICRQWLSFVPDGALKHVRGIRIDHTHHALPNFNPCSIYINLALNEADMPVIARGEVTDCSLCDDGADKPSASGPVLGTIDLILKDMLYGGQITSPGIELIFDLLGQHFPI